MRGYRRRILLLSLIFVCGASLPSPAHALSNPDPCPGPTEPVETSEGQRCCIVRSDTSYSCPPDDPPDSCTPGDVNFEHFYAGSPLQDCTKTGCEGDETLMFRPIVVSGSYVWWCDDYGDWVLDCTILFKHKRKCSEETVSCDDDAPRGKQPREALRPKIERYGDQDPGHLMNIGKCEHGYGL